MPPNPDRWPKATARMVGVGIAVLLLALVGGPSGAAGAPPRAAPRWRVRVGSAAVLPRGAVPLMGATRGTAIQLTVVLKVRDPAGLAAEALSVSTPGSRQYRRFLTPREFAERYGARPAVVRAVRRSLHAHGLVAGPLSPNGLTLHVRSTVAAVQAGFAVSLRRVRLVDGKLALMADRAPALDGSIAPDVATVIGLDGLMAPTPTRVAFHATRKRAPEARLTHTGSSAPAACRTASELAAADRVNTAGQIAADYQFSPLYALGDEGQGVTIGVYELESYDSADIAAFASCYGLTTSIRNVTVDGGAGTGPGSGEAALDIEQAISFAPRAHVIVYTAPNSNADNPGSGPYDALQTIVSQDVAQVISNSWGECEPVEGASDAAAENVLLEEAAVQGQTFVSAAGDDGAQDCDQPGYTTDDAMAVDDPASQPFATGVGGTSIGAGGTESVWNSNGVSLGPGVSPGAGGGGVSNFWPMPTYQNSAPATLNVLEPGISNGTACHAPAGGYCREVPDVSADADPATGYVFYYNGSGSAVGSSSGWQATGGTSAAAPVWAALIALADASAQCDGRTIGFANPALYRLAADGDGTYFHDVTVGNNDFTGASGTLYSAGPGYDMASGLGSPDAAALAGALCDQSLVLAAPAAQRSVRRASVSLPLSATDAPGATLHYTATGLPPGLSIGATTGVISGQPTRTGRWTVKVLVSDTTGAQRTTIFRWMVQGAPSLRRVALRSEANGTRALALTIAAGRLEPALRTIAIVLPFGVRLSRRGSPTVAAPGVRGTVRSTSIFTRSTVTVHLTASHPVVTITLRLAGSGAVHLRRFRVSVRATDAAGTETALSATPH